jgi:hypothetical protein
MSKKSAVRRIPSAAVDSIRARISDNIRAAAGNDYRARVQVAVEEMTRLGSAIQGPEDHLQVVIWALHALFNVARVGSMNTQEITTLTRIATLNLKAVQSCLESGELKSLRRHLALSTSQVHRRFGDGWTAAWELVRVRRMVAGSNGVPGAHELGLARQLLRLGMVPAAQAICQDLVKVDLEQKQAIQLRLLMLQIKRISGDADGMLLLADQLKTEQPLKSVFASPSNHLEVVQEWEWHIACASFVLNRDLMPILKMVGFGGSHCTASYIIEAFLWATSFDVRMRRTKLRKMRGLIKDTALGAAREGALYKCAVAIENAMEQELDVETRAEFVWESVTETSKLQSVEQELLVLACGSRILRSLHLPDAALLIRARYESLCRSITDGANLDTLGWDRVAKASVQSILKKAT